MVSFAGAVISLVVVQAWGDAIDGLSVRSSWRRSGMLVAAFILIAAGVIGLGGLLR